MVGLEDAIAHAGGDASRGNIVAGVDVKAIRKSMRKTQREFADTYHLPVGTVRGWEQGIRAPDAPARVLLRMIESDPEAVERLIAKAHI